MDMAIDFENKFFEQLENSVKEVRADIKTVSGKIDKNTVLTNKVNDRVDALDKKVFGKKSNALSNLFQDKQIIYAFLFALMVFLLILASVLHVKIPAF